MGNSCRSILRDDDSELEFQYEQTPRTPVSVYKSTSSSSSRSLKHRLLSPALTFPFQRRGGRRGELAAMATTKSKTSVSLPPSPSPAPAAAAESALTYARALYEQQRLGISSSAAASPLRAMDRPKEEVNRDADDFISKMRLQMSIERQVSELEFQARLQRSAG